MRLAPRFGSLVFAAALCGTPVSAQTPSPAASAETQAQVSPAIRQRQVLSGDPSVAPRIDNAPIDPDLKGFIDLPGTRTKLKVGGNAKLDVIHDFQPAGESDALLTSAIPVGDTTGADNTSVSVRQSRIGLELRRPTPHRRRISVRLAETEDGRRGSRQSGARQLSVRPGPITLHQ
jgi:hypothetical protein